MSIQIIDTLQPLGSFPVAKSEHIQCGEFRLDAVLNASAAQLNLKADKTYVDNNFAKKAELPTKTSQLQNDSGFLTQHQSLAEYAKKSEIPTKASQLTNDVGYLTEHQDISGKADVETVDAVILRVDEVETEQTALDARMGAIEKGDWPEEAEILGIRTDVNGKSYETAGDAVRGQINDVYANINQYMHEYAIDITSVTNTIYVKAGETIRVVIESIRGRVNIYTDGHSGDLYGREVAKAGVFEYQTTYSGLIRFYPFLINEEGLPSVVGSICIKSRIDETNDKIEGLINAGSYLEQTKINSLQIKTKYVKDSMELNDYSFNFRAGDDVKNWRDRISGTSGVARNTAPVRIRNNDGSLVYPSLRIQNGQTIGSQNAVCAYMFDKQGKYLRHVTYADYKTRGLIFEDDEYFAILNSYPTVQDFTSWLWKVEDNIDIEWLNKGKVYTVGVGKDFPTFTSMLIALENDTTEKTVYVDGGVYDIYQEIGGDEFINSIVDPSALNWRDVNHLLPSNTTLIGKGNVVLKFEPTAAQIKSQSMAFLFSPLNVSGNCHVENITIRSKNCRYSLHDECSGKPEYDGISHEFVNVKCYHNPETYGIQHAYGAGHSKNSRYLFKDCVFKCTKGGKPWSSHDWAKNDNETTSITFENCIIDGKIRLSSSSTSTSRADDVMVSNTYLTGVNYSSESSGTSLQQGYKVTLLGCTDITDGIVYDSNIAHTFTTDQYNSVK